MEDIDEKVKQLREGLRSGRISKTSNDVGTDDPDNDFTPGTTLQNAGRESGVTRGSGTTITRDNERYSGNGRGAKAFAFGSGPTGGRYSQSNGGALDDTAASAGSSRRLVADAPVPDRIIEPDRPDATFNKLSPEEEARKKLIEKYPKLPAILANRPDIKVNDLAQELGVSAGTAHKIKKEWAEVRPQALIEERPQVLQFPKVLPGGKTLTDKEVAEYKDSFPASLVSDFQALDEYLWMRQKAVGIDKDSQPVWSDLDEEELNALTRVMMKWGKKSPAAAAVVRATVDSADYIAVGSVFAPRVRRTVDIMRETRIPRKGRVNDH